MRPVPLWSWRICSMWIWWKRGYLADENLLTRGDRWSYWVLAPQSRSSNSRQAYWVSNMLWPKQCVLVKLCRRCWWRHSWIRVPILFWKCRKWKLQDRGRSRLLLLCGRSRNFNFLRLQVSWHEWSRWSCERHLVSLCLFIWIIQRNRSQLWTSGQ